jgi:Tol biopolymer transport system component
MLTGRRLFAGDTVSDVLAAVLRADVDLAALPAATPPELRRLVRRCLERNPKSRLRDMGDARLVLEEIAGGRADDGPAGAMATAAPRRSTRALLAASALLVATLVALGAYRLGRRIPAGVVPPATAGVPVHFQQLTDTPGVEWFPSLSPDGKDVVFARIVDGRSQIMLQRVGTRAATLLSGTSGVEDREPAFSPDGNQIAFRSDRDGGGIFLMDTSGESVRRLSDYGFYPSWSPDGKEIAVSSGDALWPTDRAGTLRGLWAIDVASGKKRVISADGDVTQPQWSPHGQRIAFWSLRGTSGQRDIFTVAADGSEVKSPIREVTRDAALDWSPTWSPDGRSLYFASNRGGTMNLWRVGVDEATGATHGKPEPVTLPALWVGGLSFSRDGKRLAFGALDWRSTLYRAELDVARGSVGTPVALLKGTQPFRDHSLSPDGQWIAFNRTVPQEDLFVARSDGSELRRLTDDAFRDRGPTWAPDGKSLVFYSDRAGGYDMWAIQSDGSGLRQLTTRANARVNFPSWSPDGKRIAFTDLGVGAQILDMDGDRPGAFHALPPPAPRSGFWPLDWSPDGTKLAGIIVRDDAVVSGSTVLDLQAGTYEMLPDESQSGQFRWVRFLADGRRLLVRDRAGIWLLDAAHRDWKRLVNVSGYMSGDSVGTSRDDRWLTWSETGTEGDVWVAELP